MSISLCASTAMRLAALPAVRPTSEASTERASSTWLRVNRKEPSPAAGTVKQTVRRSH